MPKTFIHVNQGKIRSNIKNGNLDPVITIKPSWGKGLSIYCHEVEILGPSKVVYSETGDPILHCGARVVIETESEYRIVR